MERCDGDIQGLFSTVSATVASTDRDGDPASGWSALRGLCALVATEVNASLRCLPRLTAAMRLLGSMLRSLSLVLEPYLHQVCNGHGAAPPSDPPHGAPPLTPL